MSIRQIQISRVLEEVVRTRYATGIKPTINQVFADLSTYFSTNPAGNAVRLPFDSIKFREVADTKTYNQILANSVLNLDVLYEAALEESERIEFLVNALQSHIDRLKSNRKRIENTIDDYLLSLYNTDGYFFSISDTFANLDLSDLSYTSAFIDTTSGCVELPAISNFSTKLDKTKIGTPIMRATVDGVNASIKQLSPFLGAVEDTLKDLIWSVEIEASKQAEVVLILTIPLDSISSFIDLSRVDFVPYGIQPVQLLVEMGVEGLESAIDYSIFGGRIETSGSKISLSGEAVNVKSIRLTMKKTRHDFTRVQSGSTKYVYMFGAKEIGFINRIYDNDAVFVSSPLAMPEDINNEFIIDAVSVIVDEETPSGSTIRYFIASEPDTPPASTEDFDWKEIQPSVEGEDSPASILRFDGASSSIRNIRLVPGSSELQLISLDESSNDLRQRNPTPAIIPGVDIYRLASFPDEVILNSLKLEEGVNTTRSYYVELDPTAVANLSFWTDKFNDPLTHTAYGRIDTGNDFFYGGDIGESDISVFTETFLYSDDSRDTFISELSKPDQFSQTWEVRVFLNGREIGYLPVGTNKAALPWTLKEGRNHIIMLANIPSGKGPGTIKLLANNRLDEFGIVKLDDWTYVDFFDMQYNQNSGHKSFTINEGQLISRYRPSDNFKITYSKQTSKAPSAIRFRADLAREFNASKVTPKLDSYRVRFSYGVDI